MEKCKYCQAELAENGRFCPNCGRDNGAPAEQPAAEVNAGPDIVEEKKATPGKIALVVAAIVVVAAVIVALLMGGMSGKAEADVVPAESAAVETVVPATIPADGNPDDATCKGSYTASDEEVIANGDTVVATAGDFQLTNSQLQVYYWMEFEGFMTQYGTYASYFGLDYTQPMDTQLCGLTDGGTWQQFFLETCLGSWQNYQAMAAEADLAGFQLDEESQNYLDTLAETLQTNATANGFETVEQMLEYHVGGAATMEDYISFMETYYKGYSYFNSLYAKLTPTDEEIEDYFAQHETEYADAGITREDKYVDVRHILIMPEGGTTDENGTTTYSDEEWEIARQKAQDLLDQWLAGDKTEDSFAALANEHTQDGNDANYDGIPDGGLYTNVVVGQMVSEFENWCFDAARAAGDTGLVQTRYGYHVMYLVNSRPIYVETVSADMVKARSTALIDETVAKYPLTVSYKDILLATSGMTEAEG